MKKSYEYKGVSLMRGSKAYELYELSRKGGEEAKKADKALKAHMKELDVNEKALLERYGNS